MTQPDSEALRRIAAECVQLSADQFGETLDWSLDSLVTLDGVCSRLLDDGPLTEPRLSLWWQLIGAYTGEVVLRTYGGSWIDHPQAQGAYAISTLGITGFPFAVANRILTGEPFKSLASFARAMPAISARTNDTA
ncbi:MAG: hypothetical protein LBV34_22000 [Nocardiopsaceae bacterium]|nr:hypothetical protein [Nocardiopsaceae bacterium]